MDENTIQYREKKIFFFRLRGISCTTTHRGQRSASWQRSSTPYGGHPATDSAARRETSGSWNSRAREPARCCRAGESLRNWTRTRDPGIPWARRGRRPSSSSPSSAPPPLRSPPRSLRAGHGRSSSCSCLASCQSGSCCCFWCRRRPRRMAIPHWQGELLLVLGVVVVVPVRKKSPSSASALCLLLSALQLKRSAFSVWGEVGL